MTTANKPRSRAKGRTITRWINLYPDGHIGEIYFTREHARANASSLHAIQHKITITLPKPGDKSRGRRKAKR